MAVACKYQKYRAKEQFINHDKEYDRIMVSCALTKSLCPAQVVCSETDQYVLSADRVQQCKNYEPIM